MNNSAATILIVDDDPKSRKLLQVLLQHEGYRTINAVSGDEALALIEHHAPDLILLDILMPTKDGYQVARTLKAQQRSSNIPIIMISAHCDRAARLDGLNAGAEAFLSKPVDADALRLWISNLLGHRHEVDTVRNNGAL